MNTKVQLALKKFTDIFGLLPGVLWPQNLRNETASEETILKGLTNLPRQFVCRLEFRVEYFYQKQKVIF
jgi:hypothetical protein